MTSQITVSVLSLRQVAPKPDGTSRRNAYELDILVDGVLHNVHLRRESGALKGETIVKHPRYAEIHQLVVEHLRTAVLEPAMQEMRRRRAAGLPLQSMPRVPR